VAVGRERFADLVAQAAGMDRRLGRLDDLADLGSPLFTVALDLADPVFMACRRTGLDGRREVVEEGDTRPSSTG